MTNKTLFFHHKNLNAIVKIESVGNVRSIYINDTPIMDLELSIGAQLDVINVDCGEDLTFLKEEINE